MSRLLGAAKRLLRKHPLLFNTSIYGTFYTAAEMSQQTFNKYYTPEKPDYDFKSAARVVCTGTFVYAPTLFFWYRYLDSKLQGTALRTVAAKVVIDQFGITPVLLAIFFIILGYLEGKPDVFQELKDKYWTAFVANQGFWIPGQTINFALVPPNLRIVYISTASFIWINVLCFIKRQKVQPAETKEL